MLQLIAAGALAATAVLPAEFPEPQALEPNVVFWERVYSEWESDEVVLHDRHHLGVVYRVVDLGEHGLLPRSEDPDDAHAAARRTLIRKHLREVVGALARLEAWAAKGTLGPAVLSGVDAEVYDVLASADALDRLPEARSSLRWQYGLADRFRGGLDRYDAWGPHVRAAFAAEGLPLDLVALAFVESLFEPTVYSHAGAAGLFQMMPGTAKELGLTRSELWDERLDPVRAAEAAARMLRNNYEMLGSWPLALTGYNHGPYGVRRAVKKVGSTDLMTLIDRYRHPNWGFASTNFYAEFLAARRVLTQRVEKFGDWVPVAPEAPVEVRTPGVTTVASLAGAGCLAAEDLRRLNPGLLPSVREGDAPIPQGFPLRLPAGSDDIAFVECAGTAASRVLPPPKMAVREHRVRRGESLWVIARRYGSTVEELRDVNGLGPDGYLLAGQVLKVPYVLVQGGPEDRVLMYLAR